jgi:hypothetical protein
MQLLITILLSLFFTAILGAPTLPATDESTTINMSAEVIEQLRAQAQAQTQCQPGIGSPGSVLVCWAGT